VRKVFLILSLVFWLAGTSACSVATPVREARGLWVECEGTEQTLSTREGIDRLVRRAEEGGFNLIFAQVYRHDRAWFNSRYADTAPYREILAREKIDPLTYLITRAYRSGIQVHAWMNMFRIGRDRSAPVLKRFGTDVITRDGKGVSLLDYPAANLPDGGYWLDPGDPNVSLYLRHLIAEVIRKYPGLAGVHLDFIRYPFNSPYAGSFWANRHDLGYGKESVLRFREKTGIDPLKMEITRPNCQAWDSWRRLQVNNFVSEVRELVGKMNPSLVFSVAAVAWADRSYLSSFQDWRCWLEEGAVDVVAPMNYGADPRLARYLTWSAVSARGSRQVYIGLGEYLLKDQPEILLKQMADARQAGADGIVLFSYDSMCSTPGIFKTIRKSVFRQPATVPEMEWKKKVIDNQ
jgi:uncharacterized lipoprotein YddW (UPF0748 family)